MSIPINTECILCQLERNLKVVRHLKDEQTAVAFIKDMMRHIAQAPEGVSSAYLAPGVAALMQQYYGLSPDRYCEEKIMSNRFALERMADIRKKVSAAVDSVFAALQFAILGNYLDFAALRGQVSMEKLDEMLAEALDMELDGDTYRRFRGDLEKGKKLLYITDNAGEIVFDRILAEEIQKAYPHLAITFCVRGGPVHNDATRADAEEVGIDFAVMDNGNTYGGTEIAFLTPEMKTALEEADVIIAKGMGNTESMFGCGYNVYYGFLVKCKNFAQFFNAPLMKPMFVRERKEA